MSKTKRMDNLADKNEDIELQYTKTTLWDGTQPTKTKVKAATCYEEGCGKRKCVA